ncbi:MAG: molecular chaperone TorD family protein [Burkholderiales bacterium]
MSGEPAPLQFAPTLPPEEAARADFYGLLARLFYAPPEAQLLASIAAADEIVVEQDGARAFARAWRELRTAAAADADAAREEYESLFVGTGKAPVSLYAGAYLIETAVHHPLVELRDYLAAHGLARRPSVHEPEDHIAALFEVMRHLVAEQHAPIAEQDAFFMRFLWPCAIPLCESIELSVQAHLYKQIAMFARSFLEIEFEAFRI